MILEFDAGNSFIKWRLLGGDGARLQGGRLAGSGVAELTGLMRQLPVGIARVRAGVVAAESVRESLAAAVKGALGLELELARTLARCAGVRNSYRDPGRMGVDRWLAVLAAYQLSQNACCVVDCGSAITVDLVDPRGAHLGGYIMPGLRLLREGLLRNTSRVLVDGEVPVFDTTPGCSTDEAVAHGVNLMFAALAERVVRDLQQRQDHAFSLWITGGDGALFQRVVGCGELREELVMDGLALSLP